ncbi:MAG: alpha-glucan family phosphorylase [Anaerolineae bacterium]
MNSKQPLKILILSPEVFPYTRGTEMAEAVGKLPKALKALGHDVRVVMPRYGWIPRESLQAVLGPFPIPLAERSDAASIFRAQLEPDIPIYFVDNPRLLDREGLYMYADDAERFILFQRAALEMLPRLDWQPDILHANGWPTALIPNWLRTIYAQNPFFQRMATIYTIHNLAHQGIFGEQALQLSGLASFGLISHPQVAPDINQAFDFMARGILFADGVSTVSENYAHEIQTPDHGEKLDPILRMRSARLRGIANGIDYAVANPATDPDLASHFDADHLDARATNKRALQVQLGLAENPDAPLIAFNSPLDDVHGLKIFEDVADHVLDLGVQLVVMGTGDQHYRQMFLDLHNKLPKQVATLQPQDDTVLRQMMAGADIFLVPSQFEPDGMNVMLAMHYGCVPAVRATGGLGDSVRDLDPQAGLGTGLTFTRFDRWALFTAVVRALESYRRKGEWREMQRRGMAQDFSWDRTAQQYVDFYEFAISTKVAIVERQAALAREIERTAQIMATLPARIQGLRDLAYNLWGGWQEDALRLWQAIDPKTWEETHHNPVKLLRAVTTERLQAMADDADFVQLYDRVMAALDQYMHPGTTFFDSTYPYAHDKSIAYFSAEFGLHETLPIYSGGLGILAGDHTKESSDLGIPLIGIGFLYPQGYFRQEVDAWGNQIAIYDKLNFAEVPAVAARDANGKEIMVSVELPGRTVHAKVWQIQVGRVPLYLMDTDVEANAEHDRQLSARLYGGDHEMRIMQEIVLGIGGVRVLRAMGIFPGAYHMNEGHSTFLILELIRELTASGHTFEEARRLVSAHSVFTVHTPVAAGNDAFWAELMDKYFGNFYPQLKLSRDEFLNFARQDGLFSMTVLGLRGSGQRNGVSRLHGEISRNMWQFVWPTRTADQVPIGYITNGVHTATWIAPELDELFKECLGAKWYDQLDNPKLWEGLTDEIAPRLWQVHMQLKRQLVDYIRNKAGARLIRIQAAQEEIQAARTLLDPEALTIGFARRFATYKRATLMFRDSERLKRILNQPGRPVQIIFSGKAHPADEPGKDLIRAVINYSKQPGLEGRIAFIENYGIADARYLVRGVDIWGNNPRRPLEASGTSGEKAGLNGAPNLSILDGWWIEGYNGKNGWAIGDPNRSYDSTEAQDEADAQSLYSLLENQVVPLYYERGADGVPHGWTNMMIEAIRSVAPAFSARRMLKEYILRYINAMTPENVAADSKQSAGVR